LKQHIIIPALFCEREKADFYFKKGAKEFINFKSSGEQCPTQILSVFFCKGMQTLALSCILLTAVVSNLY